MIGAAPPFRPNPFRDIESATVRQFEVDHISIKSFLFDSAEKHRRRIGTFGPYTAHWKAFVERFDRLRCRRLPLERQ